MARRRPLTAANKLAISRGLKRYWAAKGKGGSSSSSSSRKKALTAKEKAREHQAALRRSNAAARARRGVKAKPIITRTMLTQRRKKRGRKS